jgi:hypothetical protein
MKPYLVALLLMGSVTFGWADIYGRFDGSIKTEWLDEGPNPRVMRLLEEFAYVDADGKRWVAPEGAIVDGASIPRPFWPVIGGPFDGYYRNASVVHDYYCVARSEPWEEVHRMFYHAMRAAGVAEMTAKVMFYAVWNFGPRWEVIRMRDAEGVTARTVTWVPKDDPERREIETEWIRQSNPSLDEIIALSALREGR